MFVFAVLIFLISFGLTGRAQNDFFKQLENILWSGQGPFHGSNTGSGRSLGSMHGLSPLNGLNQMPSGFSFLTADIIAKDFVDETSLNRVVTMLQGHIKQWSFIEAQLLEPNVNLGMPEIVIPLKHLTSAYELLANIFYMQDKIIPAKDCLESVCPLIELLPPNLHDGRKYSEEGCFALLREVYKELIDRKHGLRENHSRRQEQRQNIRRRIGIGTYVTNENDEAHFDDPNGVDSDHDKAFGSLSNDFDIESRIEELRAPFDHLRSELRHSQQSSSLRLLTDSPLLSKAVSSQEVPVLVFEDGQIRGEMIQLRDMDISLPLSDPNLKDMAGMNGEINVKLNDNMQALIQRFVYENEGGRMKVLEETRSLIESIRNRLADEGLDEEKISYQLRIGDIVGDVMQQAIKQGLSFVGDEIYNTGLMNTIPALSTETASIYEYNKIFSKSWSNRNHKGSQEPLVMDQIRLFVLEAFDQVLEAGEIGIGTGSNPSQIADSDMSVNPQYAQSNYLGSHNDNINTQKKSRREKRRQLEGLSNVDTIDTPENVGILKQSSHSSSSMDRISITNAILFITLSLLPVGLYFFYRDFQRRYVIIGSRARANRIVPPLQSNPSNTAPINTNTSMMGSKRQRGLSLTMEVLLSYFQYPSTNDNPSILGTDSGHINRDSILSQNQSTTAFKSKRSSSNNAKPSKSNSLPSSPSKSNLTAMSNGMPSFSSSTSFNHENATEIRPLFAFIHEAVSFLISFTISAVISYLPLKNDPTHNNTDHHSAVTAVTETVTIPNKKHAANIPNGSQTSTSCRLPQIIASKSNELDDIKSDHAANKNSDGDIIEVVPDVSVAKAKIQVKSNQVPKNHSSQTTSSSTSTTKVSKLPTTLSTTTTSLSLSTTTTTATTAPKAAVVASTVPSKEDDDILRVIAEVKAAAAMADDEEGWIVATQSRKDSHGLVNNRKQTNGSTIKPQTSTSASTSAANKSAPHSAGPKTATNNSLWNHGKSMQSTTTTNKQPPRSVSKEPSSKMTLNHSSSVPNKSIVDPNNPLVTNKSNRPPLPRSPTLSSQDAPRLNTPNINMVKTDSRRGSPSSVSSKDSSNVKQRPDPSPSSVIGNPSSRDSSNDRTMVFGNFYSHDANNHQLSMNSLLDASLPFNRYDRSPSTTYSDDSRPSMLPINGNDSVANNINSLWDFNQIFAVSSTLSAPVSPDRNRQHYYPSLDDSLVNYYHSSSYNSNDEINHLRTSAFPNIDENNQPHSDFKASKPSAKGSEDTEMKSYLNNLDNIEDITVQAPVFTLSAAAPSFTPSARFQPMPLPIDISLMESPSLSAYDMQSFHDYFPSLPTHADDTIASSYLSSSYVSLTDINLHSSLPDMSLNHRKVTIYCTCSFLPVSKIKTVSLLIHSSMGYSTSDVVPLKHLTAEDSSWGVMISFPWTTEEMTYSYIAEDTDGSFYEEQQRDGNLHHVINLRTHEGPASDAVSDIELHDYFEFARSLVADNIPASYEESVNVLTSDW